MRVFVLAQAYQYEVGSEGISEQSTLTKVCTIFFQNFVYILNINEYLSMHVKSPMQIGTGRVDLGELTQGRVDLGNELTRGQLDPLPGRWRIF